MPEHSIVVSAHRSHIVIQQIGGAGVIPQGLVEAGRIFVGVNGGSRLRRVDALDVSQIAHGHQEMGEQIAISPIGRVENLQSSDGVADDIFLGLDEGQVGCSAIVIVETGQVQSSGIEVGVLVAMGDRVTVVTIKDVRYIVSIPARQRGAAREVSLPPIISIAGRLVANLSDEIEVIPISIQPGIGQ